MKLQIHVIKTLGLETHLVVVNGTVVASFLSNSAARNYIQRLNNTIKSGVLNASI